VAEVNDQERRQEERVRVATPVLYSVEERMLLQSSHDVSSGGLAVACPYRPNVGAPILLRFTHPRVGGYVSAEGIVVYVAPADPPNAHHRIGVKFSKVSRPAAAEPPAN
jgi:Tfp pilus assembly protein PilZ